MWDKGVCLSHAITFTITIEKMAMEGIPIVVVDYKDVWQHTMAENATMLNQFLAGISLEKKHVFFTSLWD